MENDNDIRKKEKKLDSNHWMCKIQLYTLGIDAPKYYMGYCPFFWVTVLCLFLFPFILLIRGFIGACRKVDDWTNRFFMQRVNSKITARKEYRASELSKIPLLPNDHMLRYLFVNDERLTEEQYSMESKLGYCDFDNMFSWLECKRMALWVEQNPNWKETHYPAAWQRICDAREERERKEKERREREKRWEATKRKLLMKGAICGKLLFKVVAVALLAVLAVGIYIGVYKVVTTVDPLVFLQAAVIICAVLTAGCVVKIIVGEILFAVENSESKCFWYSDWNETKLRWFAKPFGALIKVFILIAKGIAFVVNFIVNTISFLKEAVGMMYKAECPLIVWGEETGPIEKRNKESKS